jgi:uncharacterized ferritin-like protein (DUF455 family)
VPEAETAYWSLARAALAETEPAVKCESVDQLWQAVASEDWRPSCPGEPRLLACGRPGRPERVAPSQLRKRGLGTLQGRVALIHAVAHIEFNAINLALDAALRFAGLPDDYYRDWLSVAADEARHFRMLGGRLAELGAAYGDLPAHNGLWDMAEETAHDPLVRMALVPRVLEARGLDVTPGMIERLERAHDTDTAALLKIILDEEEGHVAIGTRWFHFLCQERSLDPEKTFADLLIRYYEGRLRGPFNLPARRRAGFSDTELARIGALNG